jgi:hypothetical protein
MWQTLTAARMRKAAVAAAGTGAGASMVAGGGEAVVIVWLKETAWDEKEIADYLDYLADFSR